MYRVSVFRYMFSVYAMYPLMIRFSQAYVLDLICCLLESPYVNRVFDFMQMYARSLYFESLSTHVNEIRACIFDVEDFDVNIALGKRDFGYNL